MFSPRAQRLLASPSPILRNHLRCAADPYSPDNPKGIINLGTAENYLVWDRLREKLTACQRIEESDSHYNPTQGLPVFREAIAAFLTRTFASRIAPEELVLAVGATAILDMFAYAFCAPGEGILIPAPYYPGFDIDLGGRAEARAVPASLPAENGYRMTESCLEAGLARAREQGIPIRALLVTSPNNPLGTVLSADEVRTAIEFARRHRIEVAFDEIYAHSIFSGRPFESALRWREAYPDYRDHVHFIYGMSKDFTLGGLRIGIYHNPSPEVLRVMASLAYFSTIPADTQRMLAGVLADAAWVDAFLAENRRRLGAALACWNTELQSHTGAGAFPAEAGVFAWLDLRPWLDEPTFAAEQRLYEKMITTARVSVLPGEVFHSAEPGWFRSCFAQSHSTLREAAERLAKALKK